MRIVTIHEAKTHLARLVAAAADGQPFVIARAGTPLVKVMAVDAPAPGPKRRVGFMEGRISTPDHFDRLGAEEIAELFEARE